MTTYNAAEAIARAKEILAAKEEAKQQKAKDEEKRQVEKLGLTLATPLTEYKPTSGGFSWNEEQATAIDYATFNRSFCLIGAAGTGKTTTLKGAVKAMLQGNTIPPLEKSTKWLSAGAPGICFISYTRRAVRNIAKQMPDDMKGHCITYHKLMEYEPVFYEEWDAESGQLKNKMRFEPARNKMNPLPRSLTTIVVDEASMLSIDYFNTLLQALPAPSQVQFIFLGDLNQLPPVYGQAVLGKALLTHPIVELTRVYRQALESPIISLALAIKNNKFDDFITDFGIKDIQNLKEMQQVNTPRGRITLRPWKRVVDKDDALYAVQGQIKDWILDGTFDPEEDVILCPWNKSFGTDELNKAVADTISTRDELDVWEVIAGFNKHYFAVGDRLLVDKADAKILDIYRNPRYLGTMPRAPSKTMNRWGTGSSSADFGEGLTAEDIDEMLLHAASVEDRTHDASHCIKVLMLDTGEEKIITDAATINASVFSYCLTVHKAQGSEWRKVFLLTHDCHSAMCSRELVYTAVTRASEELYVLMPPKMMAKAASRPRIKGDTLAAKLEFFTARLSEKEVSDDA